MAAQIPSTSDIIGAVGGKGGNTTQGLKASLFIKHSLPLSFCPIGLSRIRSIKFFFFFFVFIYLAALGLSCNM